MLWLLLLQEWNNHSSPWMSNIHCIYLPHLIYPVICGWTFRLFPCLFQAFFLTFLISYIISCSIAKSCLSLCDHLNCSMQGSSVHGISRQEYWSRLIFPSPGDLLSSGIKPAYPALTGGFFSTTELSGKPICLIIFLLIHMSVLYDRLFRHYHLGQRLSNLLEGAVFRESIWWNSHMY